MTQSMVLALPYAPGLHPVKVASPHHLKYALDGLVAPGDIDLASGALASLAACRLLGGGVMLMATLNAHTSVRHERHHLRALESDDVIATMVLEGSGCVVQGSAELPFERGDVVYRQASQPSTVRIDQHCRLLLLRFSFGRFHAGHRSRFAEFTASRSVRGSPLLTLLWGYIDQVLPSLGERPADMVAHAEQAFVSLLSAAYAESRQAKEPETSRWDVLVSTLDTLMCEPGLTVAQLSKTLGISPRLVHKLFEMNGHRYGAYLLEKRLERTRFDLVNPQFQALSVAEIAYRAGFNSASHFSRCFRQRYGAAPSAYRQGQGEGGGSACAHGHAAVRAGVTA